ncbi:hypothetical protein F2Q69_00015867 [Brassica cretica]|uniref:Uncharacterized protein n=1 Tax=Brassica cretica TaxID=69181 RepID=A0A8S9R3R9_BRACR|nr:hypothetical protein F2Q69_00015867 [Brassica cretica]
MHRTLSPPSLPATSSKCDDITSQASSSILTPCIGSRSSPSSPSIAVDLISSQTTGRWSSRLGFSSSAST